MIPPPIEPSPTIANTPIPPMGLAAVVRNQSTSCWKHRERLRQCLMTAGAENLPDYELLELMLFASNPRAKVESLVAELLERFGSLAEVLGADAQELAAAGLGIPAIAVIKFIRELALRFLRAELRKRPVVGSWDKLIDYCTANIAYSTVEEFHILFLDGNNALIRDERQQRGTVDHTPVYTREVVKRALDLGALGLILVHNHPSGDPTPSTADIAVTKDIVRAAELLGMTVHDHLIIGRGSHASLRELGLLEAPRRNHPVVVAASLPAGAQAMLDNRQ